MGAEGLEHFCSFVRSAVAPHSLHPVKELTDRNETVEKWHGQEEAVGERYA